MCTVFDLMYISISVHWKPVRKSNQNVDWKKMLQMHNLYKLEEKQNVTLLVMFHKQLEPKNLRENSESDLHASGKYKGEK